VEHRTKVIEREEPQKEGGGAAREEKRRVGCHTSNIKNTEEGKSPPSRIRKIELKSEDLRGQGALLTHATGQGSIEIS